MTPVSGGWLTACAVAEPAFAGTGLWSGNASIEHDEPATTATHSVVIRRAVRSIANCPGEVSVR